MTKEILYNKANEQVRRLALRPEIVKNQENRVALRYNNIEVQQQIAKQSPKRGDTN